MQSLLNIDEYFVDELQVKTNPNYKKQKKEEKGEISTAISIKRKGKEPFFMIQMKIELNKAQKVFSSAPYYLLLEISGFFSFMSEINEETINKMIGLNGPVILYGVARGVVAQATANCRHGKFILPTVNLLEAMKKDAEQKKRKTNNNLKKR